MAATADADHPVTSATYTREHIATLLSCSVPHVDRLARARLIPGAFKAGRLVRFSRAAVDAWLASGGGQIEAE